MKGFRFDDFSGGITDKDIPGVTNRYSVGDNFLIDYDKKPYSRDGFDILSSTAYQLPAAERVAALVNFKNDSELLAFQNKKAFAIAAGAWAEVAGPGGGSSTTRAFNTNTADSLVSTSQWNSHLYAASDSGDPVVKMYRDSGNTMRLRTAGLPEATAALTPTDGGLALAISLANDLRTQMIAHYGSNGATAGTVETVSTKSHLSHADLTAQFNAVNGSTAATDLASLITLVNLLRTNYKSHIADAQLQEDPIAIRAGSNFKRQYHAKPATNSLYTLYSTLLGVQPIYYWTHFLNLSIEDENYSIASTAVIADVLPYLNDLREKWNMHQYATITHFNAWRFSGSESYTQLGVHKTAIARVEPYSWASIAPNYGPFIQFVKDLKTEFDYHRTGGMHSQSDTITAIPSGYPTTPTTIYDAVILLGAICQAMYLHVFDSDAEYRQKTATSTSGSNVLTAVSPNDATGFSTDFWLIPIFSNSGGSPYSWFPRGINDTPFDRTKTYRVNTNDAGASTITLTNNLNGSYATSQFIITGSFYHLGTLSTTYKDSYDPFGQHFQMNDIDYRFTSAADLQLLADFVQDMSDLLKNHILDKQDPLATPFVTSAKYEPLYGKKYLRYSYEDLVDAVGSTITPHTTMENNQYFYFPSSAYNQSGFAEDRFSVAPLAASFNYKMLYRYDYTVGSSSFTDRGAPSTALNVIGFINEDSGGGTEIGKYAATISNWQVYANAANENWDTGDTTNFKKELYRTLGNGQNYYRIDADGVGGSYSNATTSALDVTTDTYLPNQLALYTNDGTVENNRPPAATHIHVFNNVMYYVLGTKVYQSALSDPDSVPADSFADFEETMVAVSSSKAVPIAFSETKVYRITGFFDDFGRGQMSYESIFDRTGLISKNSIVRADNGVFFAGKDGFYFTDGYQCMRVMDLEQTFREFTNSTAKKKAITGTYDNISKKVYWTVNAGSGSYANKIWVLDLKFGIIPDKTPITTFSGATNFNPTAVIFYGGILNYGDGDGYIFKQTQDRAIDLEKNTGVAATSWNAVPVVWTYKSCNLDYGSTDVRKYFLRVAAQFEQLSTNLSVQITSDADKGRSISTLPVIRSRKLITSDSSTTPPIGWGDSKIDWLASVFTAKAGSTIDEWRWFNGDGYLRSNFRAIQMSNAYCVIVNSTDIGTVTLVNTSGTSWTVTLTSLVATRKWPLYSYGYYFKLNGVEYPITSRTSDSVVVISAAALAAPASGVQASWELWGVPKNEIMRMISYNVDIEVGDQNQTNSEGPVVTGGQNA